MGNDLNGYEPCQMRFCVADGSLQAIGHLFAASLINGGPGANYLAPWVYNYLVGGLAYVLTQLPLSLNGGAFNGMYEKVI